MANSFTSQRSNQTRGMRSHLHGDEVCPMFAEQTMVPFQPSMRGKQDIVYVGVHGASIVRIGSKGNKNRGCNKTGGGLPQQSNPRAHPYHEVLQQNTKIKFKIQISLEIRSLDLLNRSHQPNGIPGQHPFPGCRAPLR